MKLPITIGARTTTDHVRILLSSYRECFKQPLITGYDELEEAFKILWQADFVLLSHGTEEDPLFNFGNQQALARFEIEYKNLVELPSRKSAGISTQQERNKLLETVTNQGYIDNYCGIRTSTSGKQFYIENAKVWNLTDEEGGYCGQAAMFDKWTDIS